MATPLPFYPLCYITYLLTDCSLPNRHMSQMTSALQETVTTVHATVDNRPVCWAAVKLAPVPTQVDEDSYNQEVQQPIYISFDTICNDFDYSCPSNCT